MENSIVLFGRIISKDDIKVDLAKVELIEKLLPLVTIK